jgi:excisionase family DNA binding protein
MAGDVARALSTGEAARLCSVKPDTILKWIKKGRLPALTTAGGHHRVLYRDLAHLVAARRPGADAEQAPRLRCWEYMAGSGPLPATCLGCVAYRLRAARCFEALGADPLTGHGSTYCAGSCTACGYYQRVTAERVHVVVVSQDRALRAPLASGEEAGPLDISFAGNAYEAAARLHAVHPPFVVVDENIRDWPELVDSILCDRDLRGVKILLATGAAGALSPNQAAAHGIAAQLSKPLRRQEILEAVESFPVERT